MWRDGWSDETHVEVFLDEFLEYYKTKVWTDFDKDRDKIQIVVILLVYDERERAHDNEVT